MNRIEQLTEKHGYLLAVAICVIFVMTRYFVPDFFDNEVAYSINPIKFLHPWFLERDFLFGDITLLFLVYDAIAAPFYALFDFLTATFILRILIWTFQVWALTKLCRTLGVKWWGVILLFILWINVEQTLVAGEWIFRSANAKPVAYGFIFLSLDSLIRNRYRSAGAFSGLAVTFHIVVGFWSGLAVFSALAISLWETRTRLRDLAGFCGFAVLLALPGMVPAVYGEILRPAAALQEVDAAEVARLSVIMANPFHLDPDYFMTGLERLKVPLYFIGALVFSHVLTPRSARKPLTIYLTLLGLFFGIGLIARRLDWFGFLKYYPFRVADAMIPLTFWIGFVLLFQRMFDKTNRRKVLLVLSLPLVIGTFNFLNDLCEPESKYTFSPSSFVKSISLSEPRASGYWFKTRGTQWYKTVVLKEYDDMTKAEHWIAHNTPRDALFISPPWELAFSLKAERSEVVSLKSTPVDHRLVDWKRRMKMLNGGHSFGSGWQAYKDLRSNYYFLTPEQVLEIHLEYGPEYIITSAEADMPYRLMYENPSYKIYRLGSWGWINSTMGRGLIRAPGKEETDG